MIKRNTILGAILMGMFLLLGSCKAPKNQSGKASPEDYVNYIDVNESREMLYHFASDEFEGRETGEPGQKLAAAYLKEFYQKIGIAPPKETNEYYQPVPGSYFENRFKDSENVMAMIQGREFPNEVIVVSAHYDHLGINDRGEIFNGADDDGSGTIAVLQMAKALRKAEEKGKGPKRSVLFLHFTGEEKGLLGSRYYVDHPVVPLEKIIANLNTDMIGRIDDEHLEEPEYLYLIGSDRLSSELDEIVRQQNDQYTQLNLDYKYNRRNEPNRLYYRSDHYNFAKHNIPVVFFFSGLHRDYHRPTDTADKIEYELMQKRTQLIYYTLWELANRAEKIKVDKKD